MNMRILPSLILMIAISLPAIASPQKVIYEITAAENHAPYSRFEIEYEAKKLSDGTTELFYRMPKTLLGQEQEFRFRGVVNAGATAFTLSSENGEMKCEKQAAQTLCVAVHKNVVVNLDAVKAELETMPISIEERARRLGLSEFVARQGGDMVGTLTYLPGVDY